MEITEQSIFQTVVIEYGVTKELIMSFAKPRRISDARHMAMYLLHKELGCTLVQIAEIFDRSHPSICHAIKKMQYFVEKDEETRLHYAVICDRLGINKTKQQAAEA